MLPPDLGLVDPLQHMDISGCTALLGLPQIGNIARPLCRPVSLAAGSCASAEAATPAGCSGEPLLQLTLRGLQSLRCLPDALALMDGLVELDLSGCWALQSLP